MQRSDWFAVLFGAFILGAGAYLSTFSTVAIRWTGGGLVTASIIGLLIWWFWVRQQDTNPFSGLTNAQLRERTKAFADEIRHFEAQQNSAQPRPSPGVPFQTQTESLLAWHERRANLWSQKYKVQAQELDEVLRRRSGAPALKAGDRGFGAIHSPLLAGVRPISDAAEYLERLAGRL